MQSAFDSWRSAGARGGDRAARAFSASGNFDARGILALLGNLCLGATLRAPRFASIARNSSSLSSQLSAATKQMAAESVHYDLLVRCRACASPAPEKVSLADCP